LLTTHDETHNGETKMRAEETYRRRHMKCGKRISRLLAIAVMAVCPVVAEEAPGRTQGPSNDLFIVRQAILFLRSQGVLIDHEYCVQGPGLPMETPPNDDVAFKEGTPPETVLNKACGRSHDYAWLRDVRSGRYLVRPATNALSDTEVTSMSITNHTVATLFSDTKINRYMTAKGILWSAPWPRQRTGRDIYVDFEFAGGSLADFLTETARNMGQGVCWDMKQWMSSMIRVPVGNRMVDRPQVGLDFTPATGGSIAHLKPVLRAAETGELENMLSGANPRKRVAVARELASRYIGKGDMEKANSFFQTALDASEHEHERWELKLRMLEDGLGYPIKGEGTSLKANQLEMFVRDCAAEGARHEALSRLLDIYLKGGETGKARALIETTSTNAMDAEWTQNAAQIFRQRNPAASPLSIPSNAIPARTSTWPAIRTTHTIKKTADGKLEGHVTTTEIPAAVDANK
jgi:hypothetical protein